MKRKTALILMVFAVVVIGYQYYYSNYTDTGIFDNVIKRQGYTLKQIKKPVSVELFIKPEWIPFKSDEQKKLTIKLIEKNSTNVFVDNVLNRGNDIYFNFHTTFNMKHNNGEFLYNGVFNDDGTFTTYGSPYDFILYDKNGNKIDVGQTGDGPNADFSFGVNPENQELLRDGFYVKYSGFILYEYSKK